MSSAPTRPDQRRLRIADLEIDVARLTVRRGDEELALPRLSFDLLLALAEIAPAVATTDLLLERVWPGLVVNPETVGQRVKLLRAALSDDPRQPRYLMVVRGRGYRLLPAVEWLPPVEPPASRESPQARSIATATATATSTATATATVTATAGDDARPEVAAPGSSNSGAAEDAASSRSQLARAPARRAALLALSVAICAALGLAVVVARRPATTPSVTASTAALRADAAQAHGPERSIVVMPFDVRDDDGEAATLARGIEESVTYRLGALPEVLVIASSSARAAAREGLDAVALGRRLDVRYLLEGSVQRLAGRARVTATLVDAGRGVRIWTAQLDRASQDVFAIQDEIGVSVARALKLRLDAPGATGAPRGTRQFEAWLEYLRGRELMATGVVADLPRAIERLTHALRLDPRFARAHVELARAELLAAEFGDPATRGSAFAAAAGRAREHVARALEIDPRDGRAWLQRAYLASFSEPTTAEADFRRGLALSPSEAEGWEGLAALTYRDPARSAEALAHIERARRLDPLEPRYDVTKAVFLLYRRGDVSGAEALLRDVLERQPRYVPALSRLGEALWCCSSDLVGGIRYLEQALAEDPQSEWTRRALVQAYAALGEDAAAAALARALPSLGEEGAGAAAEARRTVRRLPIHVANADWRNAGETALRGFDEDTVLEIDDDIAAFAVRRHARDLEREALGPVIDMLGLQAGVSWDARGAPMLDAEAGLMSTRVALVDLLQLAGESDRATRLLERVLADMQQQSSQLGRGALWFAWSRPIALMLHGEREAALAALEAGEASGALHHQAQHYAWHDPVLQRLRDEPRFRRIVEAERRWLESQRLALKSARAAGLVPEARR